MEYPKKKKYIRRIRPFGEPYLKSGPRAAQAR